MKNKKREIDAAAVWDQYQRGCDHLSQQNLYEQTDENFRMFEGDQWYGVQCGGERLPVLNIIAPIVKYKVAMVAQNGMSIHYSSMNYDSSAEHRRLSKVCQTLNRYAERTWEHLKMDKLSWDVILNACVAGSSYLYFYQDGADMRCETIDNTSIYFADEQQPDIQRQKYILIAQRRFVSEVREEAARNGVKDVELIVSDDDTWRQAGTAAKTEVSQPDDGKCTCLLKLWKQDGTVHICRTTKNVVYQPDTKITGMHLYPVCTMLWEQKKGSARSDGAVRWLIPNQLEINKAQARLSIAVKKSAYPTLAYKTDAIENPAALDTVGATIEVNGASVQEIDNIIKYVQPAQINPLAYNLIDNLMGQTRELAGSGDAALGIIDPEKASGAAIIAVRDAAAIPLNATVASYQQFVEDVALVWYDLWAAYNPGGLKVLLDEREVSISADELQKLKVSVRVDVSAKNPYSKYAQERALENLMAQKLISFEEYVEALDEGSAAPKGKLLDILQERKTAEEQKYKVLAGQQYEQNQQLKQQLGEQMASNLGDDSELKQRAMLEALEASLGGAAETGGAAVQ